MSKSLERVAQGKTSTFSPAKQRWANQHRFITRQSQHNDFNRMASCALSVKVAEKHHKERLFKTCWISIWKLQTQNHIGNPQKAYCSRRGVHSKSPIYFTRHSNPKRNMEWLQRNRQSYQHRYHFKICLYYLLLLRLPIGGAHDGVH
jgi:hypothetical protein